MLLFLGVGGRLCALGHFGRGRVLARPCGVVGPTVLNLGECEVYFFTFPYGRGKKMNGQDGHSHAHGHTHGHAHSHTQTKTVINRIARAVGHLTAVRNMVEEERDCTEVLVQLAAVRSAINGICEVILKDHLEHCIVDAVETGDTEAMEKLKDAIELIMK